MENKENQANDDDFGLPDISPKAKESAPAERKTNAPVNKKMTNTSNTPQAKSSGPIVATMIVVLLVALALVYFFVIRKPVKSVVSEEPKDTTQYVIEKPLEEPVIEEPAGPAAGTITIIEERTGKSYVVVGSFFDEDLANDYAQILAKEGKSPRIIKPSGKNKFHRVAVEEFDNYNDAFNKAEAVSQDYKEKPWALKY